jgi:hypothetical protein
MIRSVYLKTRGVDPKTHPVVQELVSSAIFLVRHIISHTSCPPKERVKQYFDKIKEAEDPAKRGRCTIFTLAQPANTLSLPRNHRD